MKYKLIIISFFFCGIANSQIYTPVQPSVFGHNENRAKAFIVQHVPEKDTTTIDTPDTTAQIFYNRKDSSIWAYSRAKGFFRIGTSTGTTVVSGGSIDTTKYWNILGNNAVDTNFIGNRNKKNLHFKVNNTEYLRIDTFGLVYIGPSTGAGIFPLNDTSQITLGGSKTNGAGGYIQLNSATPKGHTDSGSVSITTGNITQKYPKNNPLFRVRWADSVNAIYDNMIIGKSGNTVITHSIGASVTSTAMLDIRSTTGGLLIPRMTTAQAWAIGGGKANSNIPVSTLIYNIDSGSVCMKIAGVDSIWAKLGLVSGTSDPTLVHNNTANTYNGVKQTFVGDTNTTAFRWGGISRTPNAVAYGDAWFNTSLSRLQYVDNTLNIRSIVNANEADSISNKDLSSPTNKFPTPPLFTTTVRGDVPPSPTTGAKYRLAGDSTWKRDSTGVGQVIDEYAANHPIFIDSASGSYSPKPFVYSVVSGVPHFKFPVVVYGSGLSVSLSTGKDSVLLSSTGGSGGETTKSITIGTGLDAVTPSGTVRNTWKGDSAITLTNEVVTGTPGSAVWTGSTDAGGTLTIQSTSNTTKGNINIGTGGAFHNGANNYISGLSHLFAGTSTIGSSSTTTQPSYRRLNNTTAYTPHLWIGDNSFDAGDARPIFDATFQRIGFAVGNDTGRIYSAGIEAVTSTVPGKGTSLNFLTRFEGDSAKPVMKLDSLGAMWLFKGYGTGSQTGTGAYDLQVTAAGKVIASVIGTGGGGNVTTTGVQEISNKRIVPRTVTYTSNNVPTFQIDTTDIVNITALTVNIDSFVVTGTPKIGERVLIIIKGNGTHSISWGSKFISSTTTLPTTTNSTNRIFCELIWTGFEYQIIGVS